MHMTDPIRLASRTYLIGSGKGGVGKSTVAVNLAVALAKEGWRVGLLDADLYGPSLPIMFGLRRMSPQTTEREGKERVLPFTKFGVSVASIGFFMEEARSVIWRGPILHGTLERMLHGVDWGELDFLLVDLPPGTGDVQISLAQLLETDGAFVVSTPQEVAMLDAIKAINAFQNLEVPLLGIIENMAGFQDPHSSTIHHIFGQGKAEELAQRFSSELLGTLPLLPAIREGGDEGRPYAFYSSSPCPFSALAQAVLKQEKELHSNPFL